LASTLLFTCSFADAFVNSKADPTFAEFAAPVLEQAGLPFPLEINFTADGSAYPEELVIYQQLLLQYLIPRVNGLQSIAFGMQPPSSTGQHSKVSLTFYKYLSVNETSSGAQQAILDKIPNLFESSVEYHVVAVPPTIDQDSTGWIYSIGKLNPVYVSNHTLQLDAVLHGLEAAMSHSGLSVDDTTEQISTDSASVMSSWLLSPRQDGIRAVWQRIKLTIQKVNTVGHQSWQLIIHEDWDLIRLFDGSHSTTKTDDTVAITENNITTTVSETQLADELSRALMASS